MTHREVAIRALKIAGVSLGLVVAGALWFVLNETKDEINANVGNIEEILEGIYDEKRLAGFGVAVFSADRILYSGGFGYADLENRVAYTPKTMQHIASVSKTMIGVALLQAQDLGHLTIEDPINQHLPFQVANPSFPDRTITIRQLANHTSSLDYNEAVVEALYVGDQVVDPSLNDFMEGYFQHGSFGEVAFTEAPPGQRWSYSNIGAGLAAYVVERATGIPFSDFTQQAILDPLGLEQTRWFDARGSDDSKYYESGQDTGVVEVETSGVVLYPARDLISNVEELARYGQAVMAHSPQLLSLESFDLLLEPSLASTVDARDVDDSGLFWMIDRNQYGVPYRLTGMNGGDNCINSMLWFDPVLGVGYLFLGNTGGSELNRVQHIRIFRSLASLGDNLVMSDPKRSRWEKIRLKWHNLYSRVAGLF